MSPGKYVSSGGDSWSALLRFLGGFCFQDNPHPIQGCWKPPVLLSSSLSWKLVSLSTVLTTAVLLPSLSWWLANV